jgi:hypothetical protein
MLPHCSADRLCRLIHSFQEVWEMGEIVAVAFGLCASRFVWARRGLCRCFSFLEKIHVESCSFPSSPLLQQDDGVEKHTERRALARFGAFWGFGVVCGPVCGAVCGAVRFGLARCGAVRCGAARFGAVRCGAFSTLNTVGSARCRAVRFGAVRCGAVRRGAVRRGAVRRGAACYGTGRWGKSSAQQAEPR